MDILSCLKSVSHIIRYNGMLVPVRTSFNLHSGVEKKSIMYQPIKVDVDKALNAMKVVVS